MSFVKISSTIRPKESEALNMIKIKNASIVNKIQRMALRVMKKKAPVKSGKFKNSIRIVDSKRRESGGIFQGFVKIMPTAAHSKYVIKKTSPSQGTYVPVLKKRIKFGMHPGTKANDFITLSRIEIIQKTQTIVDDHYGFGKFNIRRFIS